MQSRKRKGFTLIELMIVVAIMGILAAVAIPEFAQFVKLSKQAEMKVTLKSLYSHVAAYYAKEAADQGVTGLHQVACVVDPASNGVVDPSDQKVQGNYTGASWKSLGFDHGFSYFRYEIDNPGGDRCHVVANTVPIYTLRAIGDLDDDNTDSMTELAIGSDDNNDMYHAPEFYEERRGE